MAAIRRTGAGGFFGAEILREQVAVLAVHEEPLQESLTDIRAGLLTRNGAVGRAAADRVPTTSRPVTGASHGTRASQPTAMDLTQGEFS